MNFTSSKLFVARTNSATFPTSKASDLGGVVVLRGFSSSGVSSRSFSRKKHREAAFFCGCLMAVAVGQKGHPYKHGYVGKLSCNS